MRLTSLQKYQAIQARYKVLYHEQRVRLDDVEATLCREFFIGKARLWTILRMALD